MELYEKILNGKELSSKEIETILEFIPYSGTPRKIPHIVNYDGGRERDNNYVDYTFYNITNR